MTGRRITGGGPGLEATSTRFYTVPLMAIRLQFLTVVVRRSAFRGCRDLPDWFHLLPAAGGFFCDTDWFDNRLWCETAMDGEAAEEILQAWEKRGLQRHSWDGFWQDTCLAASGQGPLGPCPWLTYSPASNSVWLAGTEPGEIIGGQAHLHRLERELAQAEASGEAAYDLMHDARRPKDACEDTCQALGQAESVARYLNRLDEVERLEARIAHIRAVYQSQFRGG